MCAQKMTNNLIQIKIKMYKSNIITVGCIQRTVNCRSTNRSHYL